METPCPYIAIENEKNVNKKRSARAGYANRDIQSGITFDRKIIIIYTVKDFFSKLFIFLNKKKKSTAKSL